MDKKLSSPLSTLQWVDRDRVKPNDYNPNKVSKQNFRDTKERYISTLMIVVLVAELQTVWKRLSRKKSLHEW